MAEVAGAFELDRRVAAGVQQADLRGWLQAGRVTACPVVHRVRRARLGGGFGDPGKRPLAWAIVVVIDGQPRRLLSARGGTREWTSLERLERWLLAGGFRGFLVDNRIEALGPEPAPALPPLQPWW
jgi:hypothetical protein